MAIDVAMTELRVSMPGKIESYDSNLQTAVVQPLNLRRAVSASSADKLPAIPDVPVVHPRTVKGALSMPVAAGDSVTLLFSDRAMDAWKATPGGVPVEPGSGRKHDLTDCVALLGGYPTGLPFVPAYSGALALQVNPGTKIALGNGVVEALDLVDQLIDTVDGDMDTLGGHIHIGFAGVPTAPPDAATLALIVTAKITLALIKTSLGTLKV